MAVTQGKICPKSGLPDRENIRLSMRLQSRGRTAGFPEERHRK
jgi:hypothetical protein